MAGKSDELDQTINNVLDFINQRISISTAILFGSYASGTQSDYSDIDLAVFSEDVENWSISQKIDFSVDVRINYPDVELHLFTASALEKARPSNFYGHILETGKRVA